MSFKANCFCLFCGLTFQLTAMVMSRPSVDLTTLFSWISLDKGVKQFSVHIYLGWNIVYTGGWGMGGGAPVIISKRISFSEDHFGLENSVESVLFNSH